MTLDERKELELYMQRNEVTYVTFDEMEAMLNSFIQHGLHYTILERELHINLFPEHEFRVLMMFSGSKQGAIQPKNIYNNVVKYGFSMTIADEFLQSFKVFLNDEYVDIAYREEEKYYYFDVKKIMYNVESIAKLLNDFKKLVNKNIYWDTMENVTIFSTEEWQSILNNRNIVPIDYYDILKKIVQCRGIVSCKQLEITFGNDAQSYNNKLNRLAKRLLTAMKVDTPTINGESKSFPILFEGRDALKGEQGTYIWRLRGEIMKTVEKELSQIEANRKAWLLTYNAEKWNWEDYEEAANITKENNKYKSSWSCMSKHPKNGDEVYLIKLGSQPRGIIAHGIVVHESYTDVHFNDEGKKTNYIDVEFDMIRNFNNDNILKQEYLVTKFSKQTWSPMASGIEIKNDIVGRLAKEWKALLGGRIIKEGEKDNMNTNINNFDKNIILYGPPGTGKTYNSTRYAVAICDNLTLDEVDKWDYADVMKRYNELKNADRINFVTFHQSYGYEEFIEGIKPIIDDESNEVRYSVESGIFKDFCQKAVKPDNDNIDLSAKTWLVRLNGNGKNDLKTFCFNNNVVRFNWNDNDAEIWKKSMEKIKVGDYVISYCEQSRFVDGIGIVSGDELKFAKEYDSFNWQRDVKWLATNIMEDVKPINDDKWLGNFEISSTKIQVLDLLRIVRKYNDSISKDNNKPCVFIIDEINRGNISKIFGELITLIEDTKRAGMPEEASVELPYSHKSFSVPSNVYILGTMNTADRSIAMMDTALRRRFNFIEMMPKSGELEGIEVEGVNIKNLLDAMNNRIEVLYDREHTLGHAFFIGLDNDSTINDLKNIFKNKIIPLLQEYFYEDYEKIQLVLGDNAKEDKFKFILDKKLDIKSIFKGNPNEVLDDEAKQYVINDDAFDRIESYQQIY